MAEVLDCQKLKKTDTTYFLSNPKYLNYIYSTKASVTIVNETLNPPFDDYFDKSTRLYGILKLLSFTIK
jgi:UDP-3-O-[3-hydroxymyristoyl] glucosamine N-acyltransferase